ncbi:MAG: hypothetical protein JNM13_02185 [Hyphomicrobiaceae bacterium]|nr:hypothetical protein [Hyphomicrobiaceae bacterium]
MRHSRFAAFLSLALALAACGDSGFKAKLAANCEAKGGQLGRYGKLDCACAADLLDAALPEDLKSLLMAATEGESMTTEERLQAMKDAGLDVNDPEAMQKRMREFGETMQGIEARLKAECKAS